MKILINKLQDEVQKLREQLLNSGERAETKALASTEMHQKRN